MFHHLKPREITNTMRQALPFRHLPEKNILVLADWHYRLLAEWDEIHSRLPSADIVLLLGDIGYPDAKALAEAAPPDIPILYILGNHNVWTEYRGIPRLQPLDRKIIETNGIRFGGISGSNRYSDNPKRAMRTEEEAAAIAGQLPACDILCTHTCAYSYKKKKRFLCTMAITAWISIYGGAARNTICSDVSMKAGGKGSDGPTASAHMSRPC